MKENNRIPYTKFLSELVEQLRKQLGTGYRVELHQVLKNNGVVLDAILIIRPKETALLNFYILPYYKEYQKHGDLKKTAADLINDYQQKGIQYNEILDFGFERRKDMIICQVINREKNKKLLETLPHDPILDLAVTYHCLIQEGEDGIGTVRITKEHLAMWEVTLDEIRKHAIENTPKLFPAVLQPLTTVLEEFFDLSTIFQEKETSTLNSKMYILTNQKGINGASCILYPQLLDNFSKEINNDFFILPSSIHEVILVPIIPDNDINIFKMSSMVNEINQTQVAKEEVLSNQAYLYSKIKIQLQQLFYSRRG